MATVFIYYFIGYIFPTKQGLKESFTSKVNILSLLWYVQIREQPHRPHTVPTRNSTTNEEELPYM